MNELDEINENLYLGDYSSSLNIEKLKEIGIKKVLTVMEYTKRPNYNPEEFIHKRFVIDDDDNQNIIQYFGECLNFIKGEEKVLVHCMGGASRSATIVIAYLMWTNRWNFDETFDYVTDKRPIVFPNYGFQKQLKLFEKLLNENNYDINKINFAAINWKLSELSI